MAQRKKAEKTPKQETHIEKTNKLLASNQEALDFIQKKIAASAALNGGFDTLLEKIEVMHEDLRNHIIEDDKREQALLMPDTGLFARVKAIESLSVNAAELKDDVHTLKIWHDIEEKRSEKEEELDDVNHTKLNEHDNKINDLIATRDKWAAVGKWCLVAVGGGTLSLIGKLIINLINGHVKFL